MKAKNMMIALVAGSVLAFSSASFAEVKINGKNEQSANVQGAIVNTAAAGKATARQSISSNKGQVDISGDNKQTVNVQGAIVNTAAGGWTKAEQNVSSNDGN